MSDTLMCVLLCNALLAFSVHFIGEISLENCSQSFQVQLRKYACMRIGAEWRMFGGVRR